MSSTTNYNLYLTDSDQEKFLNWRNAMNGPIDSNMIKIDTALAEKADKSESINATLLASGWSGSSAPYSQTISITGLLQSSNGTAALSQAATEQQKNAAIGAALYIVAQSNGSITIGAELSKPTIDIPICVTILG